MRTRAQHADGIIAASKNSVVSVAFPVAVAGIYDYAVPPRLLGRITPGMPVLVSLRSRKMWGVAVDLKAASDHPDLKEVMDIKNDNWNDSGDTLISLYRWVADYYQCDLGRVFRPLLRKGLMNSAAKTVQTYTLSNDVDCDVGLNEKYRVICSKLRQTGTFSAAEAMEKFGIPRSAIDYLYKKNRLVRGSRTVLRRANELNAEPAAENVILTEEQRTAVATIIKEFDSPKRPFLLHGITGSGKTHVYIELASKVLERGRNVIIMVPEIALTPQTIRRFKNALGDVVTVIHSHMSDGERRDSLEELVTGAKRVVIGVRSAVMAPLSIPGLIIVDEEHDGSYKQSDLEPRYHARDVAVMRGRLQNALVVLGSATPSLESYHNALTGKYVMLRLLERFGPATLPAVHIADMRNEHECNNWQPLSRALMDAISSTVQNNRQIILLLNRRGFSTMLLCRECGYTLHCPNCSVTLRYHRADTALKCHVCGYRQDAPDCCPKCGGHAIKYKGTGIQKIEEFLTETFPGVRILRMDQDTTRRKGAHATILQKFADQEADILLGTQMVSKGLDFPNVALVGVVAADTGLHLPDFRASERTFQLLTQVSGRAGRSDSCGEVIIQTYSPEDCAIKYAAAHDYTGYFEIENDNRRQLGYPPWGRLVRITVQGRSEKDVMSFISRIADRIRSVADKSITLLGPSPAVLERMNNESRYTILLKSPTAAHLGTVLRDLRTKFRKTPADLNMIIDVDPVNML